MIRRLLSHINVISLFILSSALTASVFAEDADTAFVPFVVNVDAEVFAVKDGVIVPPIFVTANKPDTLIITVAKGGFTSVLNGARTQINTPALMSGSHGKISLNLSGQSYKNADISLYSINGKRVLRGKVDVSQAAKNISRPNLASGAYLLSVKGVNGQSFSNRFTHRGGSLNISVAFGLSETNNLTERPIAIAKAAAESDGWTITVSADEYYDYIYTFVPVKGINPVQNITLLPPDNQFNPYITYGSFTDTRDGISQNYRTVKIGDQTWMAENLNYQPSSGNSWCYNNSLSSCTKYGRLYDWNTVMAGSSSSDANPSGVQGVCPLGWHLPSRQEWDNLETVVGGTSLAGNKLKAKNGWDNNGGWHNNGNGNGTDDFGFSALPGGYRRYTDNNFYYVGSDGYWWSSTESESDLANLRSMAYDLDNVYQSNTHESNGYSVRCVLDEQP